MKKIIKLHNFGTFKSFDATENLDPFSSYNLFFAYNGAGKTTLSRFFSFLSIDKYMPTEYRNEGYLDDFKIELDDGTFITSFDSYSKHIKVFNSDFISKEVDFNGNKLSAITVDFGSGQRKIKQKISFYNHLFSKLLEKNINGEITDNILYSTKFNESEQSLETLYKDQAYEIRQELNLDSNKYKITHFKNDIQSYNSNTAVISAEDFKQAQIIHNQNATSVINYNDQRAYILTEDEINKINSFLKKSVKRQNTSFKQEIIDWIEKGKNFNIEENGKRCFFCNNLIVDWEQRLNEINQIISKDNEFEDFEKEFNNIKSNINNKIIKLSSINFDSGISELEFLEAYRNKAKSIKEDISIYKALYQTILNSISDALKEKEIDYTKINFNDFNYEAIKNLKLKIEDFINLLNQNNNDISLLGKKQKEAFNTIINYHIQQTAEQRNIIEDAIKNYGNKIEKARKISQKILVKLNKLNNELENQSAAIETIEKYIDIVFTTKKFRFNYVEESKNYKIIREDGREAKNLSEGEKTVIAFSYFLATLEDKNINLKDTIVVIDDPVSSLDQNYLYNLLVLLYRRFKAPSKFRQLFVLTHNFYFFKKFRDILLNANKSDKSKVNFYKIIKEKDTSVIAPATQEFISYQSEYLSKISELKEFYNNDSLQETISIGIAIRKVFEIFLSYQSPLETSLFRKFEGVFKEESKIKYRYLEGIANASCHTDEIDDLDALEPFKLCVGKNEIKQLFLFIREIDEKHADALKLPTITELNEYKDKEKGC